MKHTWSTTALLIFLFVASQIIGLAIVGQYIDFEVSAQQGETVVNDDNYVIAPPEVMDSTWAFIPIIIAILIGTGLVLLIVKFKKTNLWKSWYFVSMLIALFFAFYPFVKMLAPVPNLITFILALGFAWFKTYKQSTIIHNVTEMLIYGGIAALLVPMINVYAGIILLILISVYDAFAVWKSKHMVSLATFQADSEVFAGLYIPKGKIPKGKVVNKSTKTTTTTVSYAILGGGDIAFPLIFAASVFKLTYSVPIVSMVVLGSTLGLTALFVLSKANRFYPAMPMISLGALSFCVLGLLLF